MARFDTATIKSTWTIFDTLGLLGIDPGRKTRTQCPFCESGSGRRDHTFSYTQTQWHCFRCDEGGDSIALVMKAQGVDFAGACAMLTKDCGNVRPLPKQRIRTEITTDFLPEIEALRKEDLEITANFLRQEQQTKERHKNGEFDDIDLELILREIEGIALREWERIACARSILAWTHGHDETTCPCTVCLNLRKYDARKATKHWAESLGGK